MPILLRRDAPAARRLAEQLEADFGPLSTQDKRKLLDAFVKKDVPIAASLAEMWHLPLA